MLWAAKWITLRRFWGVVIGDVPTVLDITLPHYSELILDPIIDGYFAQSG